MQNKKPILSDQIRDIRQSTFGWIDHNFLHHGFMNRLSQHELLLYYFLITVADRNGISFYDYERICQFLKLELNDYTQARDMLCDRSLIAFEDGVFQALSLPTVTYEKPDTRAVKKQRSTTDAQALKDIFGQFM